MHTKLPMENVGCSGSPLAAAKDEGHDHNNYLHPKDFDKSRECFMSCRGNQQNIVHNAPFSSKFHYMNDLANNGNLKDS